MKTAIKLVLIYLGMQILSMLLVMIPCVIYLVATGGSIDDAQKMAIAPSLLLSILMMTLYLWKSGYVCRSKEEWSPVSPSYLALSVVSILSVIWILDWILSFVHIPDWLESTFDIMQSGWVGIVCISILGPILEELLFRGAATRALLKKYTPGKAIFISALIFGVFHINPVQVIGAFFIGLLLAWIYYRSGSLIPCILIHIVNNSLSTYLSIKYPGVDNLPELLGDTSTIVGVVVAILLFILSYYLMKRITTPAVQWKEEDHSDSNN